MSKCENCKCYKCRPTMTTAQREYEKKLDIKKYLEELPELEKIIYEIEFGKKKVDKNE